MNTLRRLLRASLVLIAAAPLLAANTTPPATPGRLEEALDSINAESIKADVYFIASDELAGRDTPSPGQRVAARFIRSRLERLGWKPGAKDGYLYEWTTDGVRALDEQASSCTLATPQGEKRLELGRDVFMYSRGLVDADVKGGATFCGKGDKADFEGKKLDGRWAVCLESDIGWREREKAAKAAGAVGLVVVPPEGYAGEAYEARFAADTRKLKQGAMGSRRRSASEETTFPTLYLAAGAVAEFAPKAWVAGAELPFSIRDVRKVSKVMLETVCGFWPGSDPELAKDVIIISAHYDHVGVGSSDGKIYNGADDNGSGTCGLMAVAEALTKHGPLARSVMLMWVSGEEKGLLGSAAWTKDPWLPEGCRPFCDINIDMIGRNAPDELLITPTSTHKSYNGLVRIAEKVAPLEGFPKLGSADAYWERSDHMNFAVNLKIPVTFLFSGEHEDYHKSTDDPEKLDYDKIRRVSRMVVRMLGEMQAPDVDLK